MSKETLLTKLDAAAETLIDEAFPASKAGGNPDIIGEQRDLGDKIKAFSAVSSWMSDRAELIPDDRKSGKGEQLRDRFQRSKAPGRRDRSAAPEGNEPEGSAEGGGGLVSGNDTTADA